MVDAEDGVLEVLVGLKINDLDITPTGVMSWGSMGPSCECLPITTRFAASAHIVAADIAARGTKKRMS